MLEDRQPLHAFMKLDGVVQPTRTKRVAAVTLLTFKHVSSHAFANSGIKFLYGLMTSFIIIARRPAFSK